MHMTSTLLRNATFLALFAALISGTNNFLTKLAVTVVPDPIFYTTLKNGIVALLLVGLFIVLRKWDEIRLLSKKQLSMLFLVGAVGGALPFALYFTGLSMTTAINAGLIHKTLFLWVFLFAYPILKERLTRGQLIGIACIFLGNLFIGGFTGFKWNVGELYILLATILWAAENIIAKKALEGVSSATLAGARMIIGSVLLLAFLWVSGRLLPLSGISAEGWGWTILTSVLLFGYVLSWYTALKHAPATYVAALLVPATVVTNVLSAVFVTHAFTGIQALSAFAYALGVALLVAYAQKTPAHSGVSQTASA